MTFIKCLIALFAFSFYKCEVIDLSCDEVRTIVDSHNAKRDQVARGEVNGQPAASNMKFMIWDDELADKATRWASNGNFAHNPDHTIASKRFRTGENIYTYMTTDSTYTLNIESGIDAWFDEYKNYDFGVLSVKDFQRASDNQIGHYTQMIWANTMYVGCGVNKKTENGWTTYLLVCNYGPAGNMIGEEPYQTGYGAGELECGTDSCDQPYGDDC